MRRTLAILLALVLALSLAACSQPAQEETPAADAPAAEAPADEAPADADPDQPAADPATLGSLEDGVLSVAMECAYAPYNWTQPTGDNGATQIKDSPDYAYGYDVMMAQHIAEALGVELEIVKLDWDSLVPAVQSGTVDCVIAGQSITSERMEMVDFTTPYYYASIVALTPSDSAYASAQGVQDLAGAVCTSQINTVWYDVCLPQIPDAEILPAQESAPAMLVALDSGRCDLVVTDMPTAMAACIAYPNFTLLDFAGSSDLSLIHI